MDAISKGLQEIYFNIPIEVLNLAFNDNQNIGVTSLDEAILSRVIRPRVLVDCNLLGGIEVYVDLVKCGVSSYYNQYSVEYIVDIPKPVTNNKSIVSVLGLYAVMNNNYSEFTNNYSNDLVNELTGAMNVANPKVPVATSRLELVGENKILVADPVAAIINGSIKCVVENNSNLSNINPRSYIALSKLFVLATKAYIYNYLQVKLGKGYIYNGHELGIVNDIIASYESANEEYYTYLNEKWRNIAFHNDGTRLDNYISGLL